MKKSLLGKTLAELEVVVKDLGMPAFTAKQIADWLYKKTISSIDDMQNISLQNREKLGEKFVAGFSNHTQVQASVDGTKKYLFAAQIKKFVEAAYIPEKTRATLCVSSQVGCKMGCLFCMTGKQGFQGNLSAGEIVNQILSLPEREKLTNIVYMGMGEPLDNTEEVLKSLEILTAPWGLAMSPRRITVSTIGILPGMTEFLEKSECHLAISLHTPFEEERKKLMPIQNIFPIKDIIENLKKYDWSKQRRVSMEYIMFKGLNDTEKHVRELSRLLSGIKCRLNLIKFHPIPDTPLLGSEPEVMEYFRDALSARGITSTIRRSRGEDIYAACGMLSTKSLTESKEQDF
ncbi:MAG: 23S rRNA (adenine(2503)-C(2))-methyltransferase RlmN [Bacteroidales bacterium]|nr:23S rRNA (adenine(2503)-C(2))-methyltransferase RlmN [Bacteroidales bacterium]MCF8389479.1 23S rRNA (adenine(2503)-C(2))-methyltransferase RlmN [Bacteroidales bacterium]